MLRFRTLKGLLGFLLCCTEDQNLEFLNPYLNNVRDKSGNLIFSNVMYNLAI